MQLTKSGNCCYLLFPFSFADRDSSNSESSALKFPNLFFIILFLIDILPGVGISAKSTTFFLLTIFFLFLELLRSARRFDIQIPSSRKMRNENRNRIDANCEFFVISRVMLPPRYSFCIFDFAICFHDTNILTEPALEFYFSFFSRVCRSLRTKTNSTVGDSGSCHTVGSFKILLFFINDVHCFLFFLIR